MDCEVFEISGKVLIPTLAQTDDGFYRIVEPVVVLSQPSVDDLVLALSEVYQRGNPRIPNPQPKVRRPPVLLTYSGLKSERAFARHASSWGLWLETNLVTAYTYTKQSDGGRLANQEDQIEFRGAESLRAACQWLWQQIDTRGVARRH